MTTLATLLLADGRFPAGGHAHSAGVESAVAEGRVTDEASLADWVEGRLHTTALVDAALAAATTLSLEMAAPAGPPGTLDERDTSDTLDALDALDAEADARVLAPPLRAASRKLGRQLVRVGARCWPGDLLAGLAGRFPAGAHQPVALGAVVHAAGCSPADAAALATHHAVTTPTQAAVRLLGLDPFGVAAVTARAAPLAAAIAEEAVAAARAALAAGPGGLATLPATSSPLVELAAVDHRSWSMRLFAT